MESQAVSRGIVDASWAGFASRVAEAVKSGEAVTISAERGKDGWTASVSDDRQESST